MDQTNNRILAIAIRARWLGFAVIEGPCTLVDCGMTFFHPKKSIQITAAKGRIESFVLHFEPSEIAVARSELTASRNAPSVRSLMRFLYAIAAARRIPIRMLHRAQIRAAFEEFDAASKEDIAIAITKIFPELSWKLPRKRKTWQKEHFRMALFDAVAVGIASWKCNSDGNAEDIGTK
jgi:hypothetical protein